MPSVSEKKTSSPLMRACPVCQTPPGYACSAVTNTGRRPVTWFHLDRVFGNEGPGSESGQSEGEK
jgi:hypothetical protein